MKQLRKDRTRDAELQTLKAKLDAFHQRQNYCKHDIQVTVRTHACILALQNKANPILY
jgi:hypothetical protein